MQHSLPPVLALDVGGTKLAAAVVTPDGVTHGWQLAPTDRDGGPDPVLRTLFDLGRRALAAAADSGVERPVGAVGISCGGPLDPASGVLECPPHLPGWFDVRIGDLAAAEYGVPFALENDATAGARAEHLFGAGRGSRTMLYLTVSTGIGGGAVVDGRLLTGAAGNGGEFGHVTVQRGGRVCSCGRRGCVEAYASGSAIALRAREALADQSNGRGAGSTLSRLEPLTAADVSAAALSGDALAVTLWDETTEALGNAVTDLVNVFEPELVVLGGGVTRAGAMLFDPIRKQVSDEAMRPAARAVRIEPAELGDAVCVVGAGAVALERLRGGAHV